VFFNLFAAAEPYVSVTITHGTTCIYAMMHESSGVGEVEFSGCQETDLPSGVKRQKTCGSLGQNLQKLTIKQQAKRLVSFYHISVILFSNFISLVIKNTLRGDHQQRKNCYWIFLRFYVHRQFRESGAPVSYADGQSF